MSTPNFHFKQFTVWHDRCAMKVGTDGVLLGAWCMVTDNRQQITDNRQQITDNRCLHVLDIGTGSGLIALMLAQRMVDTGQCTMHDGASDHTDKDFHIDAIDMDEGAVEQARYNFEQSPWAEHLQAHLSTVQAWKGQYDLIVSNPPYFVDSLKNPDKGREQARHTDTLSYEELLCHSARLLKEQGELAVILPAEAEKDVLDLAKKYRLSPTRLTRVFSKPDRPTPIRILIEFCKEVSISKEVSPLKADIEESSLTIESAHSPRSEEYAEMTKDFYL